MRHSKLLSDRNMRAIRHVAESAMTSPVTIFRRLLDEGLDDSDDPLGSSLSFKDITPKGGVLGWLHSTISTVNVAMQIDVGAIVDINTFRLFVPVGTDIQPGDRVGISDQLFFVSDVTNDETWPTWLSCSLRLRM